MALPSGSMRIFGLPNEWPTIRHDSGSGAEPCVAGTLLAIREVMQITGLVGGLDRLLFRSHSDELQITAFQGGLLIVVKDVANILGYN